MSDYKDLKVWQESMDLVEDVYRLIRKLPKEEFYALSDQMRRAAISIPSNIAEGQNRNTSKEFVQYLYIALDSASELETQFLICQRLGYINNNEYGLEEKFITIRKKLNALIRSIKQKVTL